MAFPISIEWLLSNLEYIGGAGLVVALLYYSWPTSKDAVLLKRFDLNPADWKILGHDLGRGGNPYHVRALGLVGTPDFVAQHKRSKSIKAFDYKHRTYKGKPRDYEVYQVTLYCMALEQMHSGCRVEGAIRYKNKVVDVPLSSSTKRYLLSLREPFRKKFL